LMAVMAEELSSGIKADIVIKPSYGLTDGEIETMLRDSMSHAKEDIDARMRAEQRVEAQRVVEAIDSALSKDGHDLLADSEYETIHAAKDELEKILLSATTEELKKAIKDIEAISENYVAKRMNASVQKVLSGKKINEVEV
ncbi:MAG: Hsp70 family protein, partial [Deltaproteobacteria bacterium]|nr:Hsp70 family protein [Deltaproteobacteria bacterium]